MDEFLILSFLIYAAPTVARPFVDEAVACAPDIFRIIFSRLSIPKAFHFQRFNSFSLRTNVCEVLRRF